MIDPNQQSFDKKNLSPLKSGRTAHVSKALASFPPACQQGLGQQFALSSTENRASKEEKNHTKLLGQLRWRGSTADGFARGGGNNTACHKVQRMLPWDAPLGCCPTDPIILLPRQGETSPSRVRRKMWPDSIHWGDLEKFL